MVSSIRLGAPDMGRTLFIVAINKERVLYNCLFDDNVTASSCIMTPAGFLARYGQFMLGRLAELKDLLYAHVERPIP